MLKRILSLLLALLIAFSLAVAVFAAEGPSEAEDPVEVETETPVQPASFYVNGQPAYDAPIYLLNGYNYVPITTFLQTALSECSYYLVENELTITGTTFAGESLTVTARCGDRYLVANGRYLYVHNGIDFYHGLFTAPIAVLSSIFNGYAFFDDSKNCHACLSDTLLTSGDLFYNAEDLDLLSRLIHAESGNQSLTGKIAVGNVIFNRMEDSRFPDTLYGVIYAKNQFSVVRNGTIKKKPNEESVVAAKLTLEGVHLTDALYFNRKGMKSWASRNCTYVSTIGNHDFYV